MLNAVKRAQNGCQFCKFEVIHVHVDVKLYNSVKNGLLVVELNKECSQDSLADPLSGVQMQCVGYEIAEVIVPELRVFLFSFQ